MKHYLTLNEQEIDGQCSEDRKARAVADCTLSPKQTQIIHDVYYVKLFLNRVKALYNSLVVNGRNIKRTVLRGTLSLLSQFKYMNESKGKWRGWR